MIDCRVICETIILGSPRSDLEIFGELTIAAAHMTTDIKYPNICLLNYEDASILSYAGLLYSLE